MNVFVDVKTTLPATDSVPGELPGATVPDEVRPPLVEPTPSILPVDATVTSEVREPSKSSVPAETVVPPV